MGARAKRQISEEELSRWRLIEEFEWRLEKAAAVGKSRAPFAFIAKADRLPKHYWLPACPFRQPAEKLLERYRQANF